ncbi:MAG: DUF975 family protein [Prevotella sp.]|nr:DUF975 family protein [Prevotella sp.]MBP3512191.1 DUF975 family protein [Prevotella sp.]
MQTITQYKDQALQSLKGKWGKGAVAIIIYYAVTGVLSLFDYAYQGLGTIIMLFVSLPLSWGLSCFFLSISRDEEVTNGNLFDGFKEYGRIFITMLLQGIYTVLWTLLLIVPGIIKSFSYAMTPFVLKDNPGMSGNAAIEESMRIMDGKKMDLFMLYLSFIGWAILACLTLGIGFLFLIPYMETTLAHFYADAKEEANSL